jgi:hypothetical protein
VLGPEVAQALEDATDRLSGGQPLVLSPVKLRQGTLFVRVESAKTSFEDLSESIDNLLAEAGKTATLDHLMRDSKVSYPLLEANLANRPSSPATPSRSDGSSVFGPVPSAGKTDMFFGPVPSRPRASESSCGGKP